MAMGRVFQPWELMSELNNRWNTESIPASPAATGDQTDAFLRAREFDFSNPIPEPPPLFVIRGMSLATCENIGVIGGKSKSSKTRVVIGAVSAALDPTS